MRATWDTRVWSWHVWRLERRVVHDTFSASFPGLLADFGLKVCDARYSDRGTGALA